MGYERVNSQGQGCEMKIMWCLVETHEAGGQEWLVVFLKKSYRTYICTPGIKSSQTKSGMANQLDPE